MTPKRKIFLWQVFFTLLFTALFGEVYMRFSGKGDPMIPAQLSARSLQYAPSLFARHVFPQKEQSAVDMYWAGHPTRYVNAKGYRGHDFNVAKDPGTTRIIVYGGSSVFDLAMSEGNDWPHRIEQYLKEDGHQQVEVINAGIPGHVSFDAVGRLFTEGHNFDPDFVVLYGSWNDIKRFDSDKLLLRELQPYMPSSNPMLHAQNSVDRFLVDHSMLYVFLRQSYLHEKFGVGLEGAGRRKEWQKINPLAVEQFRLALRMFVDCARNIGAQPILMTEGRLIGNETEGFENAYRLKNVENIMPYAFAKEAYAVADEVIRSVAKEKNVPLVDAAVLLKETDKYLFFDHVHLQDEGSKLVAFYVKEMIEELMKAE